MISIIIPVFNEAAYLEKLLPFLKANGKEYLTEIIVVDAGSDDASKKVCEKHEVIFLEAKICSRSIQMNKGAAMAKGEVLYFVHADTRPPAQFSEHLVRAYKNGAKAGRFKTVFDSKSWLLKLNAFFTKYDWFSCYGGDQTLFVETALFREIEGFRETLSIMEDYDITERIKELGSYSILNDVVKVSARKYDKNSWWAVQRANYKAVKSYKNKVDTALIKKQYLASLKR